MKIEHKVLRYNVGQITVRLTLVDGISVFNRTFGARLNLKPHRPVWYSYENEYTSAAEYYDRLYSWDYLTTDCGVRINCKHILKSEIVKEEPKYETWIRWTKTSFWGDPSVTYEKVETI